MCLKGCIRQHTEDEAWEDYITMWMPVVIRYMTISNDFYHHFLSIHKMQKIKIYSSFLSVWPEYTDRAMRQKVTSGIYRFPRLECMQAWVWVVFLPHIEEVELRLDDGMGWGFVAFLTRVLKEYPFMSFTVTATTNGPMVRGALEVIKFNIKSFACNEPAILSSLDGSAFEHIRIFTTRYIYPLFKLNVESAAMEMDPFSHGGWPANPSIRTLCLWYEKLRAPYEYDDQFLEIRRCFPNLSRISIKSFVDFSYGSMEFKGDFSSQLENLLRVVDQACRVANLLLTLLLYLPLPKQVRKVRQMLGKALKSKGAQRIENGLYVWKGSTIEVVVGKNNGVWYHDFNQ
ncbi:unnamed protein product [Bursaphelenchus xylophilus]|uniref:(pine wood nematode) hypothetical protein n=1 Tax=Bursaphelenchus xylophilus TaxID=6326 RepID=A0A1I7RIF8_BURXY|nr:unnamed protein product [Bursaphelenchus xylophilus]CAG9080807.1 unnamed protein product [Bursaphelenchus xylophilus]